MKVALVHDWLTGMRGGEKCLEVLCELFPQADLFTLLHKKGSVSSVIENMNITCSFVQKLPFSTTRYRNYLPFFPMAIESLNLKGYDLIISSSHCVAKGIIPSPGSTHVAYVHTPMRYIWDMGPDYLGKHRGPVKGAPAAALSNYLRIWDVTSSARVDHFIANSQHIANRIKRYYFREAAVIHPPVDAGRFRIKEPEDFYLAVSALAPYKRIDIAIEAFNQLRQPLVVIGTGQEEQKLKRLSGPNIHFLGWQPDGVVEDYYARCRALIFPGEEDFGITPLEAQASGRPVLAYGRGGVLETVVPLRPTCLMPTGIEATRTGAWTGLFFANQSVEDLIETVRLFEENMDGFDPQLAREHALQWDRPVFREKLRRFLTSTVGVSSSGGPSGSTVFPWRPMDD